MQITMPHLEVAHISKGIIPEKMMEIIEGRKNENFHGEKFHRFVRGIAAHAVKLQVKLRVAHNQREKGR